MKKKNIQNKRGAPAFNRYPERLKNIQQKMKLLNISAPEILGEIKFDVKLNSLRTKLRGETGFKNESEIAEIERVIKRKEAEILKKLG